METYEAYRKYRGLNADYMQLIEQVRRNRDDARRFTQERQALTNTLWEADEALTQALAIEDTYKREIAMEQARLTIESASAAINRNNALYEDTRKELDKLKKSINDVLDKLGADRDAARKIDTVLLTRIQKGLALLLQRGEFAEHFIQCLTIIQSNLMGEGATQDETGQIPIHLEYDATMKSILSLTDMIDYYSQQVQMLLFDTVEQPGGEPDAPPAFRPKTQEEREKDRLEAQELLEEEIRPRRRERAKNLEKLAEIISSQARRVDLDPREMEDIQSVEQMRDKRDALREELKTLSVTIEAHKQAMRQLEKRLRKGTGIKVLKAVTRKLLAKLPGSKNHGQSAQAAAEPGETEEEMFIYRYKIAERELSRRHNQLLGIPDSLTEDAYEEEDE